MPPLPRRTLDRLKTPGRPSPSSPAAGSKWEEVTTRITRYDDRGEFLDVVKVTAKAMGKLGVHRGIGDQKDRWAVSHLPTGRLTALLPTEEDALRMMSFLWGRFCRAYSKTEKDEVVGALPEWTKVWVKECLAKGAYLDPGPYEKGA